MYLASYRRLLVANALIFLAALLLIEFSDPRFRVPVATLAAAAAALASVYMARRAIANSLHDLLAAGRRESDALREKMRELRDAKERLQRVVDTMPGGVLALDRRGRISLANPAMRQFSTTTRDLLGKTLLEVFRNAELEEAVQRALGSGMAQTVEFTTAAGHTLRATIAPVIESTPDRRALVVVFLDVSELRRIERMRRDFVANVSHEFKTPLTSIRGYTETLLSGGIDDKQTAKEFLQVIERNAHYLESLVNDLLVLARLEAELPAKKQRTALRSLIQEEITRRSADLQEQQIRVTVDCSELEIEADRSRLSMALSNLIDNALKYNRPGGEIRISADYKNGSCTLSITDTGYGIADEELPRIFERFYRVDKGRSRESAGTGLGLSIVKHAIESQGGSVSVESRLGVGSTFTIRIPQM
jgi:two-component system phosphate regulon sensor histidine kinase PhoR